MVEKTVEVKWVEGVGGVKSVERKRGGGISWVSE